MLISDAPRRQLSNGPLIETICQIRFPRILSIEEGAPARFQELIRKSYPGYTVQKENAGKGTAAETTVNNHAFISADGKWKINLTSSFFALSTKGYVSWENFARKFDLPFAEFIKIYEPSFFERVGLRYVNGISKERLGLESDSWSELVDPAYLGVLASGEIAEQSVAMMQTVTELMLPGPCKAHITAGPGQLKMGGVQERRFILDIDVSSVGQVPIANCAGVLDNLHNYAGKLFRGALTERALDAME